MTHRRPTSRWALWVFAAALLLKAAMPLLANASAQLQGKSLVEVCTTYGVALMPLDGAAHEPGPDHGPVHGEHCALSALAALATPTPPAVTAVAVAANDAAPPRPPSGWRAHDACASWAARLRHGPPAFA